MTNPNLRLLTAGLVAAASLRGQSYSDLVDVRNPSLPYTNLLEFEAGGIGTMARTEDPTVGLQDDLSWDGHAYYRNEEFGGRSGTLEGYAGRDGLYAGYYNGKLIGRDSLTRFEVHARPWRFFRDGAYRGSNFVPNGLYEGNDWEGYVGFGREAQEGLYIELGPFYRHLGFQRSDLTPSPSEFTIPTGYTAYGGRVYLEQNTLQMDRRIGIPTSGFLFTAIGEREWNSSDGFVGSSVFATELPSAVWRVRGRLEWYVPSSESATWEIFARGGWNDETDRVENSDSQRPLGSQWADGQLRMRLALGRSWTLTPFVEGQYSQVPNETGEVNKRKFFFGGGAETYLHLSDEIALHAWYSYMGNESRPSIRIDQDVHAEHMFYVGMVLRFGSQRR